MKLYVKNKLVSLLGSSFVLDENQNQVYKVKGRFFSFTNKKVIYDMNGKKLFVVRDKYFKAFNTSCFIYNSHRQKIAKVVNGDFDFKNRYKVMNYEEEIELDGLWGKMDIKKNGEVVGKITRDFTIIRDAYTVDVLDEENAPFYVALAIAIDNINDRRRRGK